VSQVWLHPTLFMLTSLLSSVVFMQIVEENSPGTQTSQVFIDLGQDACSGSKA